MKGLNFLFLLALLTPLTSVAAEDKSDEAAAAAKSKPTYSLFERVGMATVGAGHIGLAAILLTQRLENDHRDIEIIGRSMMSTGSLYIGSVFLYRGVTGKVMPYSIDKPLAVIGGFTYTTGLILVTLSF